MKNKLALTALLTGIFLLSDATLSAEIAIKNNTRIAFLGDGITAQGNHESGYISHVLTALKANGINTIKIPQGINNNKAPDMLARLQRDVLGTKPQVLLLNCGVNDVRFGKHGTPLKKFQSSVTEIVTRAQKAGIKVYIMTATMITENANYYFNRKLKSYNDFLRKLAKEKKCVLIDLNTDMQKAIADVKKIYPGVRGNILTYDGIHMNPMGSIVLARSILKAFGLTGEQIAKGANTWIYRRYVIGDEINVSVREYLKLSEKAFAVRQDVLSFVRNTIYRDLRQK